MPRVAIGPHFEMHPVVFLTSAAIVLMVVLLCFVWPASELQRAFVSIRESVAVNFGWLYVASMAFFFGLALWLAFGRHGHVRLGRDGETPEFRRGSWFAMLFSAGMGIGLLFFGVAEPIVHYQDTPPGFADGLDRSRLSMAVTIFHWGLHPWALYSVVGLAIAYFGFRKGLPLSFRSLLHPVLGDRVWGRAGDLIDVLAIVSTLTGVATSLGIGAQQVNAGLAHLFGIGTGVGVQMLLIAGITAMATASVVVGLHGGIRRLSELNLLLAASLMLLVVMGVGVFTYLGAAIENTGAYLQTLPFNSLRTGAFNQQSQAWVNGQTVFYWGWWISWSPFVGMFIARVSRGRTIKEFVIGVLLVPTAVGIAWLTAFGTTTLRQYTDHVDRLAHDTSYDPESVLPKYWVGEVGPSGELVRLASGEIKREQQPLTAVEYYQSNVVTADGQSTVETLPTVLFVLLEGLFSSVLIQTIAIGIATICIVLFFVTSSDSASMVIDIIASGGSRNPPVGTRLFWAISEGLVAAALLYGGGLVALQAASIAAALPLTFLLLLACYGLVTSLHRDSQISSTPLYS
ncbi:Glycine betaine transporter BetL [Stieleria maiorica]|uniref:Glycine betaine transporter BetL n=1 Tax=Stieleria maiorica TaxID=2795974 RepID=A0A5B9MJG6_9BACT|nr:BCCT family transporter [Stieleria maiorica]QEG00111.1 Glycine betaine transporter BetL [Stieleria maiorica]